MNIRDARISAALVGAILFALPVAEVIFGPRAPGISHFAVAFFGLWLVGFAAAGRL